MVNWFAEWGRTNGARGVPTGQLILPGACRIAFALVLSAAAAGAVAPAVPTFGVGSDFKQAGNLGPPVGSINWINSILQLNNSIYVEGVSVPQRLTFVAIPAAAGDVHTLLFSHQATKGGGLHAYDFLTSWSQAIEVATGKGPGGENLLDQLADPVVITGPQVGPPVTTAILQSLWDPVNNPVLGLGDLPDNMGTIGGGTANVAQQVTDYEASLGNRQITVRVATGNAISNVTCTFLGYPPGSDQYAEYSLSWTSSATTVGIELAGHLGVGYSDGIVGGYGSGFGSSNVAGGPYHFKLATLDGISLGSQDNQIKGADIIAIAPPDCMFTGPTTACKGDSGLLFTGGPFNPTITYLWTLLSNTAGASFTSATDTNQVTVDAGNSAGSFTIQLSTTSAFGTTLCVASVTVVSCASWSDHENGLAGTSGVPLLTGGGDLLPGTPISVQLSNGKTFAPCVLVVGASNLSAPFKGGVLVPYPNLMFGQTVDFFGEASFGGLWPPGIPSGFTVYFQYWIVDAAGPFGFAASNAISGTTP